MTSPWRLWTNSIGSASTSASRSRKRAKPSMCSVLTATPIPRTLVLTYFGDMDISELREKPPGRQPIDTFAPSPLPCQDVEDAVGRAIEEGKRALLVRPLVDESERSTSLPPRRVSSDLRRNSESGSTWFTAVREGRG